jgi:hypothetical protein
VITVRFDQVRRGDWLPLIDGQANRVLQVDYTHGTDKTDTSVMVATPQGPYVWRAPSNLLVQVSREASEDDAIKTLLLAFPGIRIIRDQEES